MPFEFSADFLELETEIINKARPLFGEVERTAFLNTAKVLAAFKEARIAEAHFGTTTGYAYDDLGRAKLEEVYARVFKAERALVRTQFASGTHALATVLFGILRPGDELVSVTGEPYDTMQTVIGHKYPAAGSLKEFGVSYRELPLVGNKVDLVSLKTFVGAKTKVALIQRSRGYSMRDPLSSDDIGQIVEIIHRQNPACFCFVDNCYGEFTEDKEPIEVGADIVAGSLIKNPGGGLAPTGGYVVGKREAVELTSYRLTAPGMGDEIGASLAPNRLLFQGLFLAPHIVAQALKGAILAAGIFEELGYATRPGFDEPRHDIIQAVELGSPEKVASFCRAVQSYSPVDSFVTPEGWDMPGYADQVIMAAGTFVQGASIEFSADGPMRPPYTVFLQGGLTFEHTRLGILGAAAAVGRRPANETERIN